MADFSVQDAAFTGFRVVREHPRALLVWAAVSTIFSLVTQSLLIGMAGPAMAQLTASFASLTIDPQHVDMGKLMPIYESLLPAYAVILPLSLALSALVRAAMNRVVLRPAEDRFGYFRLGGDELRQLGLAVVLFLMFSAAGGVAGLMISMLAVLAGPLALLGGLAALCGLIFLAVRLSLASALTFQTAKVNLFGSWALTEGRFWSILGTYLIAGVMVIVVTLLSGVVISMVAILLGGAAAAHQDMSSLGAYMTPARLLTLVVNGALGALIWPLMDTPAPTIYQQISGRFGAGAADAFS